jgi:hypothetical protein
VGINGCWHGDDEAVAGKQVVQLGAELQMLGGLEFFRFGFQSEVKPGFELVNALLADIKANNCALFAEFNGEWQTNVTQANDGEFDVLKVHIPLPAFCVS